MNDLKFALRQVLKYPGFTAVAVLTLAIGIGATTSIAKVWRRFWWELVAESWAHWGWVTSSPAGCLVWKSLIRRSSPSARS